MTRKWTEVTLLLLLAGVRVAAGQPGGQEELGIPFPSEHYAPPEYQQDPQNWGVVQDDQGLIYVANNDGVLQYDGERWRLIPTAAGTFVRSLAADSLVYVGAKSDFGVLRPDSLGVPRYTSLYEHIPEGERDFEDVWGTHVLDGRVYYQTNQYLFQWNETEVKSWSSEEGFHTSFTVDGTLYVRDFGRGLLRMEDDSLELVPGGKIFHETPIYTMVRHPSGDLLVGTQNKGLLLYDGEAFRAFAPELTSYLQENDLYHGCRLPGDRYALATLGGGVVVIDAAGQVVRVLDDSSGLPDPVVNHVYADREGQLWMALNSGGVFRADLNAPLTVHDERTGLDGTVRSIHEHRNTPYVATGSGLYVLKSREDQVLGERSASFEKWGDLPLIGDMLSVGENLLAGTQENGVYQINTRNRLEEVGWSVTNHLLKARDGDIVYAGSNSRLKGLRRTQDGWNPFSIEEIQAEVRDLAMEDDGTLWASTIGGEVLRVILSADGRRVRSTTRYGEQDGLPQGYKGVEVVDEHITVVSKKGLFQVDDASQAPGAWQFARRPSLLPDIEGADTLTVETIENMGEQLWVVLEKRVFWGKRREDGSYQWKAVDPLQFPKSERPTLSVGREGTVWLGDGRRLFRYAWGQGRDIEPPTADFSARVRQVTTLRRGRIVYGGHSSGPADESTLTVPYGRDLRVDVGAPLYGTVEPHQYRYKLEGRTDQWTDWTTEASQRYRDLWEGTYRFRVQARNDRGQVSEVGMLPLHIRPPWFRSRWALFAYGIAFLALALGYRRYYQIKEENRRAQERVRKLERERVVAERLKKANERLREANRLKEDFLATTSHELRTPLTNILGALEVLRDMVTDEQEEFLDMIEANGQRLKRTLNALLDLSMLRSGEEDLELTPTPLDECARRVALDLRDDAEEKGLSVRVDTPDTPVQADVDEQYLEQIVRNLVENAIKYTHNGHVAISAGRTNGQVYVEVEDTGIGIDEDFLPNAISARLAEQMDGTIHVETEKGEGSTFTVEFPRSSKMSSETNASRTGETE
ncbi:MAG: histidine kinase [Bacteroidetes bacterium QH_2_64_74]|nr:MAG: histidine kinase [Bacteroidetes bacterium QH_2_64_74]